MKRTRRFLSALLVCALALCLLTACGVKSDFKDYFDDFTKGVYYFEGTNSGVTEIVTSDGTCMYYGVKGSETIEYAAKKGGSAVAITAAEAPAALDDGDDDDAGDTSSDIDAAKLFSLYDAILTPATDQALTTGKDSKTGYDTAKISVSVSGETFSVVYGFDGGKLKTITIDGKTLNVVKLSPTPDATLIAKAKAAFANPSTPTEQG